MTGGARDDARASADSGTSTVAMARRSEADARASVAPAQKPWGASASFGRGAVKPPAHGTRGAATARAKENDPYAHVRSRVAATANAKPAASNLPPAAAAVAQKPKKTRSRPPAPAPVPAPALAAVPPVPSREMLGGLGAAASGIDHLPPALAPFRAQDWSLASTTAPVTSDTATALVAGCTLHDLAPEDKRKVAKLIKQVVEYAESKKRLEAELDETHVRLDACERSRDDAVKAEETRKAELRLLTNKLDKALATVEAYRRREKREDGNAARDGASAPEKHTEKSLWRVSPMTRAVVDEVRAVLRRGREPNPPLPEKESEVRSPAERQRPPLAVAPTAAKEKDASRREKDASARTARVPVPGLSPASSRDLNRPGALSMPRAATAVYAPPTKNTRASTDKKREEDGEGENVVPGKSPTKASRMRAAAAAAASAAFRARGEAFPATPELPEEVRAAAHAAAAASSPEDAFVAALAAGAAAAAASGGLTHPAASPGAVPVAADAERVLRFDPHRGAAGAFYFDDTSETASEVRSVRSERLGEERTVRQALGVPEPEPRRDAPRSVSLAAATRALVRLDDDMTAYGRKATTVVSTHCFGTEALSVSEAVPWWERGGRGVSEEADAMNRRDRRDENDAASSARRVPVASAFAPVRGEGASRLATIAARMARDDAYAERDAAPRSPHVPAPPASLVAAAARARVAETRGDAGTLRESIEEAPIEPPSVRRRPSSFAEPDVVIDDGRTSRLTNGEKRRPLDPTRLSRAHAAVRAAAAAVDAALKGDAGFDADDDKPSSSRKGVSEPSEPAVAAPGLSAREIHTENPALMESPADASAGDSANANETRGGDDGIPAPSPVDFVGDGPKTKRNQATERDRNLSDVRSEPVEVETFALVSTSTSPSENSFSHPSSSQRTRRSVVFDADLIDLVDEVDELSGFPGGTAEPVFFDASFRRFARDGVEGETDYSYASRGRDASRPANPRAAAAAAARRVAGRARACPEKARRRRLADEVTRREAQRGGDRARAQKADWRVDYRSFSEGKRGEPLL